MNGPGSLAESALAVVRRLRDQGHTAYYAGGCVRDMLLGGEPKDYDIATDAEPERVRQLFRRAQLVGAQFGVVRVRHRGHWIEVATFRQDIDYQDGRRPSRVTFTNAEKDARRRDFTVNGLFYDPVDERVLDFVGGKQDLEARLIRAIGVPAERFAEDHLRLLRAARLAARLGFEVDPATADAIRAHAASLARITPERVREELDKMLAHPERRRAIALTAELGLLPYLWPGSDWPPDRLKRVLAVLAALPPTADFTLGMAGMLHDRPVADVRRVATDLRSSNQQVEDMSWLVARREQLLASATMSPAELKRLMTCPRFPDLVALHEAVLRACGALLESVDAARARAAVIPAGEVAPPPFITGEDLIARGLPPGPRFKVILNDLYTAQLNGELQHREEALKRLEGLIG